MADSPSKKTAKAAAKKAASKATKSKVASSKKPSSKQKKATKKSASTKAADTQSKPKISAAAEKKPAAKKSSPYPASFVKKQKEALLTERDRVIDEMQGVTREQLRDHDSGAEASGLGDHLGDAGNDSYYRDVALSQLSMEQRRLKEIDDALGRIEQGRYGVCEGSGEVIPELRLEAYPASRYTVKFQEQLEKQGGNMRSYARSSRVAGAEDSAIESMEDSVDV